MEKGYPDEWQVVSHTTKVMRFTSHRLTTLVEALAAAKDSVAAAATQASLNLLRRFARVSDLWRRAADCVSMLDVLCGLARCAREEGMCRPVFVSSEGAVCVYVMDVRIYCVRGPLTVVTVCLFGWHLSPCVEHQAKPASGCGARIWRWRCVRAERHRTWRQQAHQCPCHWTQHGRQVHSPPPSCCARCSGSGMGYCAACWRCVRSKLWLSCDVPCTHRWVRGCQHCPAS